MKQPTSLIESLEARIAPAAVFLYTEPDGDQVTVKTARGTDADLQPLLTFDMPAGPVKTLQKLDLSSKPVIFEGTDISIAVTKRGPTGDGLVRVGEIKAISMDLGNVTVKGDLGALDCGNLGRIGPAAKSLSAQTMGINGVATQGAMPDLTSTLQGSLGKLTVAGDMQGVVLLIQGTGSSLGPAKVGGSMNAVNVKVEGGIASFTLGNDLRAGSIGGLIWSVAGNIGTVKIGGDVFANDAGPSGGVLAQGGNVKSVTIGGNVLGGKGLTGGGLNGGVYASGRIGNVSIGGDVAIDSGFDVDRTAFHVTGVRAGQDIGTVKIRGDVSGSRRSRL
jgi:hypothetical protein